MRISFTNYRHTILRLQDKKQNKNEVEMKKLKSNAFLLYTPRQKLA